MMRSPSLRLRMMALFSALVGVLLTGAYLSSYFVFSRVVRTQFDQRVLDAARPVLADLTPDPEDVMEQLDSSADDDVSKLNIPGEYFELLDGSGHMLQQSLNLEGHSLDLASVRFDFQSPSFRSLLDSRLGRLRTVFIPLRRGTKPRFLMLAISDQDTEAELASFRKMMFFLLPASLLLTALFSMLYVGRSLQPVAKLTRHAAEMTTRLESEESGEIWTPLPVSNPNDELGRLAETFNQLFRRIDSVVRQLRQFVTDASHELRTPLTVLQGETELLLSRPRTEAEYRSAVAVIDGELNKLSRIVKGLFTLSLAGAGQLRLASEPLYLNEVLEESCALTEPLAKAKQITIDRALHRAVAATGDEAFLRQLFVIFLDNAVKYSPPGTTVHVTLETGDTGAEVRFRDSGMGIATEHLPHIFERFYRAAPPGAGQGECGGLGLPIAQAIAQAHGGSIECRSAMGSGSTFTVRLPLPNGIPVEQVLSP